MPAALLMRYFVFDADMRPSRRQVFFELPRAPASSPKRRHCRDYAFADYAALSPIARPRHTPASFIDASFISRIFSMPPFFFAHFDY